MRYKVLAGLAVGALTSLAPVGQAQAATQTAPVVVSATVLSYCTVAALPLAFGNYTSSAVVDATTTLTVICSAGTNYTIGLDNGQGTGSTPAARQMTNALSATTPLTYAIYSDSGRTTVWGNTVGTNVVSGTGNGLLQTVTAYGRIPAGQYPGAGAYTDTVTATLTY